MNIFKKRQEKRRLADAEAARLRTIALTIQRDGYEVFKTLDSGIVAICKFCACLVWVDYTAHHKCAGRKKGVLPF